MKLEPTQSPIDSTSIGLIFLPLKLIHMLTPSFNIRYTDITVPEELWKALINLRPLDPDSANRFNTRIANLIADNGKQIGQVWLAGEHPQQTELIFTGINNKLNAVKALNDIFGEGLKEAKDICEVFLFPFYNHVSRILNEEI